MFKNLFSIQIEIIEINFPADWTHAQNVTIIRHLIVLSLIWLAIALISLYLYLGRS